MSVKSGVVGHWGLLCDENLALWAASGIVGSFVIVGGFVKVIVGGFVKVDMVKCGFL